MSACATSCCHTGETVLETVDYAVLFMGPDLRSKMRPGAFAPSTSSQDRCSLFPQGAQMDCKSAT
jgi:hypothetical protein